MNRNFDALNFPHRKGKSVIFLMSKETNIVRMRPSVAKSSGQMWRSRGGLLCTVYKISQL